jgi:hypothetical protein
VKNLKLAEKEYLYLGDKAPFAIPKADVLIAGTFTVDEVERFKELLAEE